MNGVKDKSKPGDMPGARKVPVNFVLRVVLLVALGVAGRVGAQPADLGERADVYSLPSYRIAGILMDESDRPMGRIPLQCSAGEEPKLLDPMAFTEPDGSFLVLLREPGEYDIRLFSKTEVLWTGQVSEENPAVTNVVLHCAREAALDIALWLHLQADSPYIEEVLQAGANAQRTNYGGQTALMIAVKNGYGDAVQALLEAGADVNAADPEGMNALHLACQGEETNMVARLIAAGAKLDVTNHAGRTPLDIAVWEGRTEVAQVLRTLGASGSIAESKAMGALRGTVRDETGEPVASETVFCTRVGDDMAARYGAMTDRVGGYAIDRLPLGTYKIYVYDGGTLRHQTVALTNRGEIAEAVEFRIAGAGDATRKLRHLSRCRDGSMTQLHEEGAAPNAQDPENGDTALHHAAAYLQSRDLQVLLEAGAHVDATNRWQKTPLMDAAQNGNLRNAECLLKAGADVNRRDHMGNTALHLACKTGHRNVAEMLVESGADLAATNRWDRTPLDEAVWENHSRLAETLRARGAPGRLIASKPSGMIQGIMVDEDGKPLRNVVLQYQQKASGTNEAGGGGEFRTRTDGSFALHGLTAGSYRFASASWMGSPVVVCLTNDWDVRSRVRIQVPRLCVQEAALHAAVSDDNAEAADRLLAEGADVRAMDCENQSLLERALNQWATNVVPVLLAHGADINAPEADGTTPLRRIAAHWLSWKIPYLLRMGAAASPEQGGSPQLLLDVTRRPSDESTNSWRCTPRQFHRAATTARFLIRAGAPVNVSDEDGMTPLHHAALNGYAQCADVLLKAGAELNVTNHAGLTPLEIAIQQQHAGTIAVLRKHGAVEDAP